jgi:isocitrate dehydrogenase kinase/phosphatase
LNLYLREQGGEAVRAAVLDYAQAITDMARNNIFPVTCCRRTSACRGMAVPCSTTMTSCAWSATAFRAWPQPRSRRKQWPTSRGSM